MLFLSKTQSTIKEVWISSFQLYRQAFSKVWYLGTFIGALIVLILAVNVLYSSNGIVMQILSIAMPIFIVIFIVYLTSLLFYQIYNQTNEYGLSFKEIIAIVDKKYPQIIGSVLIVLSLYVVGMFLLVLPGIFIFVLLTPAQPLILFDDQGIFAAIKNSCKLVWGNWWRTFAILFPLMIVDYWISFALGRLFLQQKWSILASATVLSTIFYPFYYTCVLVIFNDLKVRKNMVTQSY